MRPNPVFHPVFQDVPPGVPRITGEFLERIDNESTHAEYVVSDIQKGCQFGADRQLEICWEWMEKKYGVHSANAMKSDLRPEFKKNQALATIERIRSGEYVEPETLDFLKQFIEDIVK
jgi:hypothetical protein